MLSVCAGLGVGVGVGFAVGVTSMLGVTPGAEGSSEGVSGMAVFLSVGVAEPDTVVPVLTLGLGEYTVTFFPGLQPAKKTHTITKRSEIILFNLPAP